MVVTRALGGDLRQNLGMVLEELEALEKEMKTLQQRAKLVNLYHNYMEEFKHNNGNYSRNMLASSFRRRLSPTKRMKNCTNYIWRLLSCFLSISTRRKHKLDLHPNLAP
jgi:hypothetical protein